MNGWIVLSIVLGVGLIGAVWQSVTYSKTLEEVIADRDRARDDRAASARMFAVRKLLEAAHQLRNEATARFAAMGPEDRRGAAFWDAANWIGETFAPDVAGLPWDDDLLRAIADQVHHHARTGDGQ